MTRTRKWTPIGLALAILLTATVALAANNDLAQVRRATAAFHDPAAAEAAGWDPTILPDCFDSEAGGMGVHYIDGNALDGTVDAEHPEAIVYEVRDNKLKLVGVEYVVPLDASTTPPVLFGQEFHPHSFLPFWILHAWVWKNNPSGVFEDFNPKVGPCPEA